jgi:hypothetical protein
VPAAALEGIVRVLVAAPEDQVGGLEENDEPLGAPVWLRVTGAVKPLWATRDTVKLAEVPAVTVFVAGDMESENVGAATTVRVEVADSDTPVPAPVTWTVYVPMPALEGTVSVLVAAPEDQVGGFEEKVDPAGAPVWVRVTGAENPFCAVSDRV